MINTQREVMQQALDALEDCRHGCEEPHKTASAIKALRAALAEPAVEPVAYAYLFEDDGSLCQTFGTLKDAEKWEVSEDNLWSGYISPLYTSPQPPAEVPLLTDDEIGNLHRPYGTHSIIGFDHVKTFARAIEKAVRNKAGII